eukprot:Polyplicarium_translucidae@DN2334_c0_g1_i4.p4
MNRAAGCRRMKETLMRCMCMKFGTPNGNKHVTSGVGDGIGARGATPRRPLARHFRAGTVVLPSPRFAQVCISSLALLKMLKHGRAGVPMEVMGLMLGEFTDDYTIKV